MKRRTWYTQYGELTEHIRDQKSQLTGRCEDLGVDPDIVVSEVWQDIVARAVHESNWQEGIFVDRGKTKELALHAFEQLHRISEPHLDLDKIIEQHKRYVVTLKRRKARIEEIGAYNLSAAHLAMAWIGLELYMRQMASLASAFKRAHEFLENKDVEIPSDSKEVFERGLQSVEALLANPTPLVAPISEGYLTHGQVFRGLLGVQFEELVNPMSVDYIHFLHRIVLMGVEDPRKCGTFRKSGVHVGDPDVLFPPALLVPEIMNGFAEQFPAILPPEVERDWVLVAAEASYNFVRIHPYHDGNGRVSRLLMNLVLWRHHPPVYLKADKKGRHRYAQALKRANRGNMEPLGCLIAMALTEIYAKLIDAVGKRRPQS